MLKALVIKELRESAGIVALAVLAAGICAGKPDRLVGVADRCVRENGFRL